MLKPEHIMHLKIDVTALLAQQRKADNVEVRPLDYQFAAIGDAVLSKLLNVDPVVFAMQLDAAKQFGVSYLLEDEDRRTIGISTATSLIKDDNIIGKNLIVPRSRVRKCPELYKHYIVSLFLRGQVKDSCLVDIAGVHVAGWIDTYKLYKDGKSNDQLSSRFASKIPVVALPCSELKPINTLLERLTAQSACV